MINFYPGPSRVDENIPAYVQAAYDKGILSINHRSDAFMKMCAKTVGLLKDRLNIPESYTIFFTSSATECWEIIAQSIIDTNSYHFYSGAFGEKWFDYTKKINPYAIGYQFDQEQELKTGELDLSSETGLICITQNETSNGTQISNARIGKLRKKYPNHLIGVDATSSMAGAALNFSNADIWYASVQKCFGLPAGLGIMVCSPNAIAKAQELKKGNHYNSLTFMIDKMRDYQTSYTPNVMGIYLLMRVMESRKEILKVEKKLKKRFKAYAELVDDASEDYTWLIENEDVRSNTVLVIKGDPDKVQELKEKAAQEGIILGNGYGANKVDSFRIANFPAIKKDEVKTLKKFLRKNL
ncbi:aminotransferase class V-fold PLP-dependent enzyme [Fulvivirga sediminis]|uniref:phosphoserine transaminase n=1 Tax=Fulvivirga sediminis TaxID=2803949 RepID=A0A937F8S3_9BACT|nr:aminotransferase class V-fold PLP-dependent enzyme [Fulvivirga sediminis]MBL3656699.1 alanine--glyoxylate aminotransferase family protein [Fulvivirga sediminis]